MNCKTCRFYLPHRDEPTEGTCLSEKFLKGYGIRTEPLKDRVHVENDEGWAFVVGEEFGCVHYAPKEAAA